MRSQAVRVFVPLSIVRSLGQSVTRELQVGGWRVVPANLAPSLFYVEERRLGLSERRAEASLLLGAALGAPVAPSVFSAEQAEDGDTNPTPTLNITRTPTSTLIPALTSTLTQTLVTQTLTLALALTL